MNIYTVDISRLLNISLVKALKLHDYIDRWYPPDYSEITTKDFNKLVRGCYKEMNNPLKNLNLHN